MEPSVWLIAGPTASGKSTLALRLAETIGAEVVNADSMQLYAGLEVLTAAPSIADRRRRPHHLYGIADPGEAWSAGRWLRAVKTVLAEIAARGAPAIVIGGTGLYFRALTQGLADTPTIPCEIRNAASARLASEGEDAFREALAGRDPVAAATILPGDGQRLVRAWSVVEATGRPLTNWREDVRPTLKAGRRHAVVLDPPRDRIYARCDTRLAAMARAGALDEVAALLARDLSPELPAMKALGVREFAAHLRGEVGLENAIAAAQIATRHYAKRQLTWFRNQTPDWPRICAPDVEGQWTGLRAMLTTP